MNPKQWQYKPRRDYFGLSFGLINLGPEAQDSKVVMVQNSWYCLCLPGIPSPLDLDPEAQDADYDIALRPRS